MKRDVVSKLPRTTKIFAMPALGDYKVITSSKTASRPGKPHGGGRKRTTRKGRKPEGWARGGGKVARLFEYPIFKIRPA